MNTTYNIFLFRTTLIRCFQNFRNVSPSSLTVRCGEWDLKSKGNKKIEKIDHQEIVVAEVIIHPRKYCTTFLNTKNLTSNRILSSLNKRLFMCQNGVSRKGSFYAPVRRTTYDTYDLGRTTWKKLYLTSSVRPTPTTWIYLYVRLTQTETIQSWKVSIYFKIISMEGSFRWKITIEKKN